MGNRPAACECTHRPHRRQQSSACRKRCVRASTGSRTEGKRTCADTGKTRLGNRRRSSLPDLGGHAGSDRQEKPIQLVCEASGRTEPTSPSPGTAILTQRHTLDGPRSLISLSISCRRSCHASERTARFSCLYSAESRPETEWSSAARRRDMTSRVASETEVAVGFLMVAFLRAACISTIGKKSSKKNIPLITHGRRS